MLQVVCDIQGTVTHSSKDISTAHSIWSRSVSQGQLTQFLSLGHWLSECFLNSYSGAALDDRLLG